MGDWYQSFVVEFEFYSGSVVQVWVVCVESSVGGLGRIGKYCSLFSML